MNKFKDKFLFIKFTKLKRFAVKEKTNIVIFRDINKYESTSWA